MIGAKRTVAVGLVLLVTVTGVVSATSVVSIDGDTEPAIEEFQTGTDPFAADTDSDGLDDGVEVNEHGTDPTTADTDGDGLSDGPEVDEQGTDPSTADTDDDGLADGPEVDEHGTDPTSADTDDDGLGDGTEVDEHGTDPTAADTDGDGLPDGAEVSEKILSGADPLRTDVFVEVDYVRGHRPSAAALERVREAYASAPVGNPDDSTGFDLHLVVNESVPAKGRVSTGDLERQMSDHFDREDRGYRYAIAVENAASDGIAGFAIGGDNRPFVFQTSYGTTRYSDTELTAHVFSHELGHSAGLTSKRYEGIDSRAVPFAEYASAMNYDAPPDVVGYNAGDPFDDWAYINTNMTTPTVELPDEDT